VKLCGERAPEGEEADVARRTVEAIQAAHREVIS